MTEKVELFYIDEQGESVKGVFELRRLLTRETTGLYDLCQKRNPRTGQVVATDELKYTKLRLASMIADCPITYNNQPWKVLDTNQKAEALDSKLEEDMFLYLTSVTKKMNRMSEDTENL